MTPPSDPAGSLFFPFLRARPRGRTPSFFLVLLCLLAFLPSLSWGAVGKKIAPSSIKRPEVQAPIELTADRLEYNKDQDFFFAEGSVVVTQGLIRVEADYLTLDKESGHLIATGEVRFTDGENTTEADQIDLDINTQLGILYHARLFIKSENYTVEGEEMERREFDRYLLQDASFTACNCPDDPDWRIRARRIRLHVDDYLVVRDLVFYAGDVPIFYLPYLIYPAKTQRQSGLLVPRVGYSSRWGFRYNQDFFWAITRSQDMTFSIDHRGNKGDGGALQYRYALSKQTDGRLDVHYFHDNVDQVDRYEIQYVHEQRFSERVSGKVDLHYVNQRNNFQVLSDSTAERAQQNIQSNLFVTYRGDESFAYLLGRYVQSLTGQSSSTIPQRLPEIGYALLHHRLGESPVYFNWESTAVYFWREVGANTERVDLYPKLSLPLFLSAAGTVTPWAGFRETWYSRGALQEEAIGRAALPVGIAWEEPLEKEWGSVTHLIVPSLTYEYVAVSDRADVPQFDEIDRIHDRNSLTGSLAQRFFGRDEKGERQERLLLRLTDTYNLTASQPGLSDSHPFSDLRGEAALSLTPRFTLGIDSFYDPYRRHLASWNTDVSFTLSPYLATTFGQRYTRAGTVPQRGDLFNPLYLGDREETPLIKFLTGRAVLRSPWGVNLASRAYFDVEQSKFIEIGYGLQYERQCWSVTFVYLDLRTRNEFSFLFNLKGLGATESRKFANLF